MSISLRRSEELYGLFELDPAGTVLYSRKGLAVKDGEWAERAGRNFYDDVIPFLNVEEFRKHVTDFTVGTKVADSFCFNCEYAGLSMPVKVLVARIRERVNHENTKSVLVYIRRSE